MFILDTLYPFGLPSFVALKICLFIKFIYFSFSLTTAYNLICHRLLDCSTWNKKLKKMSVNKCSGKNASLVPLNLSPFTIVAICNYYNGNCCCVEFRNANFDNVHGRPGTVPGRVRITSTTITSQHGTHDADKRTSQNLPLSSSANN